MTNFDVIQANATCTKTSAELFHLFCQLQAMAVNFRDKRLHRLAKKLHRAVNDIYVVRDSLNHDYDDKLKCNFVK